MISDGENNVGDLDASIGNAIQAKVIADTIAISQSADSRLKEIASRTGGKHFSYLDVLNGSVSLADTFSQAASGGVTTFNSAAATVCKQYYTCT